MVRIQIELYNKITFFYNNNHNVIECVGTRHSWFRDAAGKLWFWGYPYAGHGY